MNGYCAMLGLLGMVLPSVLFASTCPNDNVIFDPQAFQWTQVGSGADQHWTGTLDIDEATLIVGGETITTRVYRQAGAQFPSTIPGPTMNMSPGEKYVLRFRNKLPYEAPEAAHNVFKDPNISNLHTHGVHISGESPGDDITRRFEGSTGGDFVYDIPVNHMGGTYWYHAHHHGSTFLQVSGGAFGMIVIDDSLDGIPASVAAMEERQLVIAYLDPDVAGTGGDTLISGSLSPTWTVNGMVTGNLCIPPDTWQHWRILLADRDARQKTVSIGQQCEVALLARDGVWRTVAPLALGSRSLNLTGASRADLAVRCSGDSTISVAGEVVANVFTDGTADSGPDPYDGDGVTAWSAQRPAYLRDLRNDQVDNTETITLDATSINGEQYDVDNPNFVLPASGLQEWTLQGARNHPFHLHIYHIQVQGDCDDYEDGEYYDVVANNCVVRFDLNAQNSLVYEGRTIMHCHILRHEDQGSMGWMNVMGGIAPPEFPAGFGYQEKFDSLPFTINPGLAGSWFNSQTSGQGFFLDVFPGIPLVFLAWFTYDTAQPMGGSSAVVGDDNHRWVTAQGPFDGKTATLDVTLTTGGLFDDPTDTTNSDPGTYGSIELDFKDCTQGTVTYDFFSNGLSGVVPITRISKDNVPLCEMLNEQLQNGD